MIYFALDFDTEDEIENDGAGCVSAFESCEPGCMTVLAGKCSFSGAVLVFWSSLSRPLTLPGIPGIVKILKQNSGIAKDQDVFVMMKASC